MSGRGQKQPGRECCDWRCIPFASKVTIWRHIDTLTIYVPAQANTILLTVVIMQIHIVILAGHFNQANLTSVVSKFYRYVYFFLKKRAGMEDEWINEYLDLIYCNMSDALKRSSSATPGTVASFASHPSIQTTRLQTKKHPKIAKVWT